MKLGLPARGLVDSNPRHPHVPQRALRDPRDVWNGAGWTSLWGWLLPSHVSPGAEDCRWPSRAPICGECAQTSRCFSIKPRVWLGTRAGFMGLLGTHGVQASDGGLVFLSPRGADGPYSLLCLLPGLTVCFTDQATGSHGRGGAASWDVSGRRDSADQHQGLWGSPTIGPQG